MTVTDRIFQNVAELSVPNFFITVEFSVMGNEMPEHIESFVLEKYQAILHGANGRKFVYTEGGWRLFFTFFPTDKVVDERLQFLPHTAKLNELFSCLYIPAFQHSF